MTPERESERFHCLKCAPREYVYGIDFGKPGGDMTINYVSIFLDDEPKPLPCSFATVTVALNKHATLFVKDLEQAERLLKAAEEIKAHYMAIAEQLTTTSAAVATSVSPAPESKCDRLATKGPTGEASAEEVKSGK